MAAPNKFAPGGKWHVASDGGLQVIAPSHFTYAPTPVVLRGAGGGAVTDVGFKWFSARGGGAWTGAPAAFAAATPPLTAVLWVGTPPAVVAGSHVVVPVVARARPSVSFAARSDAVVASGVAWPRGVATGLPPPGAVCCPPPGLVAVVAAVCGRDPDPGGARGAVPPAGPLPSTWEEAGATGGLLGWRPPAGRAPVRTPWGLTVLFSAGTLCVPPAGDGPNTLWLPMAFGGASWAKAVTGPGLDSKALQVASPDPGVAAVLKSVAGDLAVFGSAEVPLGVLPPAAAAWAAAVLNDATKHVAAMVGRTGGVGLAAALAAVKAHPDTRTALAAVAGVVQALTAAVAGAHGPPVALSGCVFNAAATWTAANSTQLWVVPLVGQAVVSADNPVFSVCAAGVARELAPLGPSLSVPKVWYRQRVPPAACDGDDAGWSRPPAWPAWVGSGVLEVCSAQDRIRKLVEWQAGVRAAVDAFPRPKRVAEPDTRAVATKRVLMSLL